MLIISVAIGFVVGLIVGFLAAALCQVAARADERMLEFRPVRVVKHGHTRTGAAWQEWEEEGSHD
jgi:hypothetical protein